MIPVPAAAEKSIKNAAEKMHKFISCTRID